jgi:hypothetical protein
MLLGYEVGNAVHQLIFAPLPFNIILISIYCFYPKVLTVKYWGHFYKHFVGGIVLPGFIQWLYILFGAIILEALEMEAEEDANSDFMRCVGNGNFTREQCRNWVPFGDGYSTDPSDELLAMTDVLGMAPARWRNWDIFGACFFCFTIISTVGYGTFAPVTPGGKLFTCAYLLCGIPLNVSMYGNIATAIVGLLFRQSGGPVERRYKNMRKKLGTSADADADGSGQVSFDEVKLVMSKVGVQVSDEAQLREMFAKADAAGSADGGLSAAEYDQLVDQLADLATQRMEAVLAVVLFLVSLALWAIFLPISDPDHFQPVDGLYFSLITFSTVGLGDKTIALAGDTSAHNYFRYLLFCALSIELGLLAAVVSSITSVAAEARALMGRSKGKGIRAFTSKVRKESADVTPASADVEAPSTATRTGENE